MNASPLCLLLVFVPIVAAFAIIGGAPIRRTARIASLANLALALFAWLMFEGWRRGFQYVFSIPILPEWHLTFSLGLDGLSLSMVLLATIVTVAAIFFADKIDTYPRAFYACLLFISAGTIGAFASLDLFFFYAFHELALIPTFLLIGIWGSGNRVAAAWKITIYLALGSFVLLLGLIVLYQNLPADGRTFYIPDLKKFAGQIPAPAEMKRTQAKKRFSRRSMRGESQTAAKVTIPVSKSISTLRPSAARR